MGSHNYGMQTFDKYSWYQVLEHGEKCAFETNAAIALSIGLTKVIYEDYESTLLFILKYIE